MFDPQIYNTKVLIQNNCYSTRTNQNIILIVFIEKTILDQAREKEKKKRTKIRTNRSKNWTEKAGLRKHNGRATESNVDEQSTIFGNKKQYRNIKKIYKQLE